jgi:hydroxymethylbilane synthase
MQKLNESDWNGAVFAAAGLERINLKPTDFIDLDWMIPAPAQGAMVIVAMQNDDFCKEAVAKLNHKETEICTQIERQFLKTLEGGCTAPIGALAKINNNEIHFVGNLFSIDGKEKLEIERSVSLDNWTDFGKECANEILEKGGAALMKTIKETLKK